MGTVGLELGDPSRIAVEVAIGDVWSAVAMYCETAAGIETGLSDRVRRHLSTSIGPAAHRAAEPIAHPEQGLLPDCLIPGPSGHVSEFDAAIERLRSYSSDEILDSITRELPDPEESPLWGPLVSRPRRWFNDYVGGAEDVMAAFGERWAPLHAPVAAESDRIGVAAVCGGLPELLASLSPRLRVAGTRLEFEHAVPGEYELGDRRLILTPAVAGPRMLMSILDHPDHVWICYPVPRPGRRRQVRPGNALALVLGEVRAAVLRALDSPRTMTDLAAEVEVAPNTLTFHCTRLEDAGLLVRRRAGRSVLVTRTRRGTELIDLMAGG